MDCKRASLDGVPMRFHSASRQFPPIVVGLPPGCVYGGKEGVTKEEHEVEFMLRDNGEDEGGGEGASGDGLKDIDCERCMRSR